MVDSPAAPALVLAFDYGTRRIGVAIGDTLTQTARPLHTIDHAALWRDLDKIFAEYRPARCVVGLPHNMDGTPTALTPVVRRFAAELQQRYHLPVGLVDERTSSREAEAALRDARASGLKRRRTTHADVDKVAARIVLERWLENPQAVEWV